MSDSLANAYMQQFKAQLGFIEQSNQVPNEIPKNVQYQEPRRVEQPPQQPPPPPPVELSYRVINSSVLPGAGQSQFGHSPVNFSTGTAVDHSHGRSAGVDFSHGTAVNVRHLENFAGSGTALSGKRFGLNDGRLEFSRPRIEKKRR